MAALPLTTILDESSMHQSLAEPPAGAGARNEPDSESPCAALVQEKSMAPSGLRAAERELAEAVTAASGWRVVWIFGSFGK